MIEIKTIASDMINVRHYIQKQNAHIGVPGTFAESSMIRTTATHNICLTKTKEQSMANFGEVMSRFHKLGKNKDMDNGLYLHTLMLFHAMCHLKEGEMSVENANKKYADLFGTFLNSASMSRNCAVLVKLGLIKLSESVQDRRQKDVMLTTVGHKFRGLFNNHKIKEAI